MEVFIAGIIQGSLNGKAIHDQDYRGRIKRLLQQALPDADVFCPFETHPQSVHYPPNKARKVFLELMERAGDADVLVAFVPQASMGTAIELWQAYRNDRIVLTISPLTENWAVRFLSTRVFESLEQFESWVSQGELAKLLQQRNRQEP